MSLTKEDLKQIQSMFNDFETKMDKKFDRQTKELKSFAVEQTEELARMIATSVVIPMNHNFELIGEKLNIKHLMIFEKPIKKYRTIK